MKEESNLIRLAEKQLRQLNLWWLVIWNVHMCLITLSFVSSIIVPFGLAALYYFPTKSDILNGGLLIISMLALLFQVIDNIMRLPERSRRLRRLHHKLEFDLAQIKDGRITMDQFENSFEEVIENHINEEQS